jgi:hypothetical protein
VLTIADGDQTEALAQPVILADMLVVTRRADEVEANPILSPVRRAFEPGLEEAGEAMALRRAHEGHKCATACFEP